MTTLSYSRAITEITKLIESGERNPARVLDLISARYNTPQDHVLLMMAAICDLDHDGLLTIDETPLDVSRFAKQAGYHDLEIAASFAPPATLHNPTFGLTE